MDGLGMENCIRASTVLYRNGRLKTSLQHKLRSMCHHTAYKGRGVRALLSTKLISNEWGILCLVRKLATLGTQSVTSVLGL